MSGGHVGRSYMLWMARASTAWAVEAASEAAQAKLYDVIMCHIGCHTGTGLSLKLTIIGICVLRTCQKVLHALNETKRSSGRKDMQV